MLEDELAESPDVEQLSCADGQSSRTGPQIPEDHQDAAGKPEQQDVYHSVHSAIKLAEADICCVAVIMDFFPSKSPSYSIFPMTPYVSPTEFEYSLQKIPAGIHTRLVITMRIENPKLFRNHTPASPILHDVYGLSWALCRSIYANGPADNDQAESSAFVDWLSGYEQFGHNVVHLPIEQQWGLSAILQKDFKFAVSCFDLVLVDCHADVSTLPVVKNQFLDIGFEVSYRSELVSCLESLTTLSVHDQRRPSKFLEPFCSLMQRYFVNRVALLQRGDGFESSKNTTITPYRRWQLLRLMIERFLIATDLLDDFDKKVRGSVGPELLAVRHQRSMINRAKIFEERLRDQAQLLASVASLDESRRSISQADSIGRATFLAMVFLPLSLVTSFFGMNISELTGAGVSWPIFIWTTVGVFVFMAYVCIWLWRRSVKKLAYFVWAPLACFAFCTNKLITSWPWHLRCHVYFENFLTDWRALHHIPSLEKKIPGFFLRFPICRDCFVGRRTRQGSEFDIDEWMKSRKGADPAPFNRFNERDLDTS